MGHADGKANQLYVMSTEMKLNSLMKSLKGIVTCCRRAVPTRGPHLRLVTMRQYR